MAVHVLTKKVVGKLYIKIHILYIQQYDRRTISISAVSNANWISLKFTRNIQLGYSSFIYCEYVSVSLLYFQINIKRKIQKNAT